MCNQMLLGPRTKELIFDFLNTYMYFKIRQMLVWKGKYMWYNMLIDKHFQQIVISFIQDHFEVLSKNKVKKRKLSDAMPLEALIKRHAGVLGLSAFVEAYPYDVPEFMPQILMDLSNHVNDPQPIQVSYRCTMSRSVSKQRQ